MSKELNIKELKKQMTGTQLILMVLAQHCATLDELSKKTGLKKERILQYLTRLDKRGLITRKWRHYAGKKFREYCLKYREDILG